MMILVIFGFFINVEFGDVKVKGIIFIIEEDIEYSKSLGYIIKLIGFVKWDGEKLEVIVELILFLNIYFFVVV